MENHYDLNLAQCYDAIVTSGYYDYVAAAESLAVTLASRKKVLELGVGTGLLAEKLIKQEFDVTGLDFSRPMLEIAAKRLGSKVRLYHQDVLDLNLPETYEVAVSHGGVWVGVGDGKSIDSHITDIERNLKGLKRVAQHLVSGGWLALGIQQEHENCTGVILKSGAEYSSTVTFERDLVYKQHLVRKEGQVLARQEVTLRRFDETSYIKMMDSVGFITLGKDDAEKWLLFQKR